MTEHMIKYMQKKFYEGLTKKDSLTSNAMLEWFNNNGVFIEDEGNFLCNECPLTDCIECNDIISKEDYLIDEAYNTQGCYNCKNFGKLEDEPYICGEDEWCEYWEAEDD